jgi:NAD(P)-dependent dehydrogenase (short-subunit alcohol dehydrogenase family)
VVRWITVSEVMAEAGADVACADIDEGSARATAAVVQGLGRRGTAIGCDVTAETEVEAMVTRTVEVLGRLDILFNNAGIADPQEAAWPSSYISSHGQPSIAAAMTPAKASSWGIIRSSTRPTGAQPRELHTIIPP